MATHRFQLVWLNWFNMVVIFSIRLSIMYEYFSSKLVRGCVTISYLEWISAPIASARFLIIFTWSISEGKESRRERHFSKWIVAPAFTCCQTFANYLEMNRWIDIYLCTKLIDDWLISWLVVWLFDWLIDRLIDWLIGVGRSVCPTTWATYPFTWSIWRKWPRSASATTATAVSAA